ncbi:MAG: hypothetical protein L3J74_13405 [Bacteroidales bacterium]|nr:hypothetical protein [Bacteroidales bacterium]
MDINKIIAIIEGKEECTKDTLKDIKKVINNFPYFQTGHMLLLKSLHLADKERYNEQLKISGVFISNKVKLFKFINSSASELKFEITQKESVQQKTDKKTVNIKSISTKESLKETSSKISLSDKGKKEIARSKERTIKDIKTEQKTTQKTNIKSTPEQKELKTKITGIKKEPKVSLKVSDDEIYEKSKQQHKKIVSDFFVDPDKKVIIIDETTKQEDIKKLINIPEKSVTGKKEKEKTVKVSRVEKIKKVVEPQKEAENIRKTETKKETVLKKTSPPVKREEKGVLSKKEEIKQREKPPVQEKKQSADKTPKKQADVMNEIFSKIRAIKKEMNIATNENKETIEISPEKKEKPHRIVDKTKDALKEKESLEKKEISIQKETIKEKIEITEEKEQIPEQIIEETKIEKEKKEEKEDRELTAWDLVKQHQKNKSQKVDKVLSGKSKIEEYLEKQTNNGKKIEQKEHKEEKTQIEKVQEIVSDKEEDDISVKISNKEKIEAKPEKPEIKQPKPKEKESAADALLRRIALKKQQLKEKKDSIEETDDNKNVIEEEKKDFANEKQTEEIKVKPEEKVREREVKEEKQEKKKVKKTQKLIEEFINKADTLERIKPDKEPAIKGDISVKSTVEKDDFITEAMADLYVQQKYYQKAIDAYKKLILKFPQKKTYFAIQIKKVESLIKK